MKVYFFHLTINRSWIKKHFKHAILHDVVIFLATRNAAFEVDDRSIDLVINKFQDSRLLFPTTSLDTYGYYCIGNTVRTPNVRTYEHV